MGKLETDQDYLDAGVEPPEHTPHPGSEGVRLDSHKHLWFDTDGPFIECHRGDHIHGVAYDHTTKVFNGTDSNGEPVFKDITLANEREGDVNYKL